MLNGIKDQIKQQKQMLEAADIIFEDGSGRNIDDQIVLGQVPQVFNEDTEVDTDGNDDLKLDGEENPTPKGGTDEDDGDDPPIDTSDIGNDIADPDEEEGDKPEDKSDEIEDIGNSSAEDPVEPEENPTPITAGGTEDEGGKPLPMPGDNLPEPIGRQTGEPAQDNNVVDVNLDLQSNTIRDVLPVPPAGAASAVVSDEMDQHVDSGFGGDGATTSSTNPAPSEPDVPESDTSGTPNPVPPVDASSTTVPNEESGEDDIGNMPADDDITPVTEAITLGGDGGGDAAATTDDKPADGGAATDDPLTAGGDVPPAEPAAEEPAGNEGENPVTSAVRDKVAETEAEDSSNNPSKEELMKKLGNLTKNLEDAKQAVMSALQ